MGTLVCFHAHPDDEVIGTGGTIARAAAEGHRVVLVVATNGEWGERPDDLAEGETLVHRRQAETAASGSAQVGTPGQDGLATLRQGYLEESSVDAVREVTELIKAQRGYELNAKVITAADQMLSATTQVR